MKIGLVGVEWQCQDDYRVLLQELIPNSFEIVASAPDAEPPDADVYIWDCHPEMFSRSLTPDIVKRSLYVIEPKLVERFRERLGTMHASILLKPVRPAALRPFLEHAVRQNNPQALDPSLTSNGRGEMNDLLDCLLHTNLKLQEYDQFRTNFLARAVHDFRTPLTSLCGYCGLLVDQRLGPLNKSQVDLLSRMQHSITRLSRLADAMFDLSVGRNVKREPDLQTGDVEAAINQAIHDVMPHADEKKIRITRRSVHPTVASTSNGDGVRSILTPNAYRIDVRDSGSGIPCEHLESIFEEYTSYSGGTDRSGGGLGLAICRMIVDAHRGTMWAESGPDGTQFSVVLPQPEAKDQQLGVAKAAEVMSGNALSA